jgi:hypothetical protein
VPSRASLARVSLARFGPSSRLSGVSSSIAAISKPIRREPRNERGSRGSPDNPAAKYLRAISPLMARDRGAIEGVIYFAYFVPRSIPAAALSPLPGDRSRELYAPAIMLMRITKITRRTRPCCTDRALDTFFEHFFHLPLSLSLSLSLFLCLLYAAFSTLRDVSS